MIKGWAEKNKNFPVYFLVNYSNIFFYRKTLHNAIQNLVQVTHVKIKHGTHLHINTIHWPVFLRSSLERSQGKAFLDNVSFKSSGFVVSVVWIWKMFKNFRSYLFQWLHVVLISCCLLSWVLLWNINENKNICIFPNTFWLSTHFYTYFTAK